MTCSGLHFVHVLKSVYTISLIPSDLLINKQSMTSYNCWKHSCIFTNSPRWWVYVVPYFSRRNGTERSAVVPFRVLVTTQILAAAWRRVHGTSIVGISVSILLHCSQIPHFLLVGLWVVPLLYTGFISWTEAHVECVCSFHSVFIAADFLPLLSHLHCGSVVWPWPCLYSTGYCSKYPLSPSSLTGQTCESLAGETSPLVSPNSSSVLMCVSLLSSSSLYLQ